MDSFYVILPSNTDVEGNTSSCFTVRLPDVLDLDSSWTVALSSIIYPVSFGDENQEGQYVDLMYHKNDPLGRYYKIIVPTIRHRTVPMFEKALQKHLKVEIEKIPESIRYRKESITERNVTMYDPRIGITTRPIGPLHGNVAIEQDVKESKQTPDAKYGFVFDSDLQRFQFLAPQPFVAARLSKQLSYVLGFEQENIEHKEIAKYGSDLLADVHQIFCYAPKLIEHTIVGNITAPILRVVNVQGEYGSVTEDIYTSEHHHKLSNKRISEITIELRNSSGKLLNFSWGTVIVTLHFERKLF